MPVLSHYLDGKGPLQLFVTFLGPFPNYFHPPLLKALFWLMDDLLKLPFFLFLGAGLLFHLVNSALLGCLSRLMGLSRRVALASGILYATLFVHFHGYLWFPVAQHAYSITAILAGMVLFFLTERRIREGRPHRLLFALTAAAAWTGSLHNSSSITLLLMIAAVRSFPEARRQELTRRWLPVWGIFLLYPLVTMAAAPNDTGISAVSKWPLAPWLKGAGLLLAGALFLALIGRLLRARRIPRPLPFLLAVGAWIGLALWDSRQLLLPYHALVPWMTVLSSFLDPVRLALQMDAADSYYYISAQVSPFHAGLALGLIGAFVAVFGRKRRCLFLLGVWYAAVLAYLLLHRHVASSMPFRTQSRYFLYITPLFSIVLAGSVTYGLTAFLRKAGQGRAVRDLALALVLLAACLPNLLAIRLALFRGRLTNTYLSYDDFRTARLIREDLARRNVHPDPESLYVVNATPTLFDRMRWDPPIDYNRIGQDHLRRFIAEAFGDRRMRRLSVNEIPPADRPIHLYRLEGDQLLDGEGEAVDPFSRLVGDGLGRMKQGDLPAAAGLFRKAALERPFLLNYLLGPRLRLADLQWITGGDDLRDLFELICARNERWGVGPQAKVRRTSELMRRELSRYVLCLLMLSALEHELGHVEESRFWLSQIGFIEREGEALAAWLAQIPEIRSSAFLRAFSEKVRDPAFFREPLVWKKEDYAFGRFLIRLIFHRDIRSSWDKRFERLP